MGDRTSGAQGKPRDLQSGPISSAFDWAVILSSCAGTLSLAIAVILLLPTLELAHKRKLGRWLYQPCQGVWKVFSRTLLAARLSPRMLRNVSQTRSV